MLSGFYESSVNSDITMLELMGLVPGQSYNVTVTAKSEYNFMESDQSTSDLVTFTTLRGGIIDNYYTRPH